MQKKEAEAQKVAAQEACDGEGGRGRKSHRSYWIRIEWGGEVMGGVSFDLDVVFREDRGLYVNGTARLRLYEGLKPGAGDLQMQDFYEYEATPKGDDWSPHNSAEMGQLVSRAFAKSASFIIESAAERIDPGTEEGKLQKQAVGCAVDTLLGFVGVGVPGQRGASRFCAAKPQLTWKVTCVPALVPEDEDHVFSKDMSTREESEDTSRGASEGPREAVSA